MRNRHLPTAILLFLTALLAIPLHAATRYVDSNATGANNGTSWTDAWKTLGAMTGLAAGDTVYISGGASGSSITYDLAGEFTSNPGFVSGTAGTPVTYKIGQDAAHNGTAIFHRTTTGSQWLFGGNNYIISGDAGDGARHFKATNYSELFVLPGSSNVRVSYVDCGDLGGLGSINPGTNIEIDHCYLYSTNLGLDHALYASINQGTAYDQSLFHDNVLYIPYTTGGTGADGFQIGGSGGWSLYNNTVTGFYGGGRNHQDGWQGSGSNYIKIYNNRFVDMQNYAIFAEGYTVSKTYSHVRVYNNVCVMTKSNTTQAIAISASTTYPINDVVCANNITDGYGMPYTIWYPGGAAPSAFVNCYFYNNVSVNGGNNIIDAGVISANNLAVSSTNAASYFTSWTAYSASSDYHLKAGATPLISAGTNASSYFRIDKDFKDRVLSGSWDLGPYINGGSLLLAAPTNARIATTP